MQEGRLFTVREVADHLKLNPETVRRWIRDKKMKAIWMGGDSAGYRIPESEVKDRLVDMELQRTEQIMLTGQTLLRAHVSSFLTNEAEVTARRRGVSFDQYVSDALEAAVRRDNLPVEELPPSA